MNLKGTESVFARVTSEDKLKQVRSKLERGVKIKGAKRRVQAPEDRKIPRHERKKDTKRRIVNQQIQNIRDQNRWQLWRPSLVS